MTCYRYEDPVDPSSGGLWVGRRLEQLERRFPDFLTSREGRFYVLFGGPCAGKTSLLKILHHRFPPEPPEPDGQIRSVFADVATVSSTKDFFELLYREIRGQLGICSIDPQEVARLFQGERSPLDDFGHAFRLIVWELESKSARLVLLLDNADELAQTAFAADLFTDLAKLFSNPNYVKNVTSQLDVVVTGGAALYNHLAQGRFPRKFMHRYNIEVLPDDAARALVTLLPSIQNQPTLIDQVLHYTGSQPYMLQYFMAQLEKLGLEGRPVTQEAVEQAGVECLRSRSQPDYWFHDCLEVAEAQGGQPIYAALAAGQPMTWGQILTEIQERGLGDADRLQDPDDVDRALDALLFHGLIRQDEAGSVGQYVFTSELFRQWFVQRQEVQRGTSLQNQLREERENLRLIEERKAEFVLEVDVPLQLVKEEQRLRERIAELEAQLARFSSSPGDEKD